MAIPPYGVDKYRDRLVSQYGKDSEAVKAYDLKKGYRTKAQVNKRPSPTTPRAPLNTTKTPPGPSSAVFPGAKATKNPIRDAMEPLNANDIRTWQKTLRQAGYMVPLSGSLDPKTRSALANWAVRHPKAIGPKIAQAIKGTKPMASLDADGWNRYNGLKPTFQVPTKKMPTDQPAPPGGKPSGDGGVVPATPKAPSRTPASTKVGVFNPNQLVPGYKPKPIPQSMGVFGHVIDPNLANSLIHPMDPSMANDGATPLPGNYGDTMAGLEFDQQIRMLMAQQQAAKDDTAKLVSDIGGWYGQVKQEHQKASKADKEIGDAGVQSVQDAGQAILSSIGGSANPGSGSVGSQVASDVGTLRALAANQDAYNSDAGPLLEAEGASAQANAQTAGNRQASLLAAQLLGLQAQRGSAVTSYQMQADQYNNSLKQAAADRLMQIQQYNEQQRSDALNARLGILSSNNSLAESRANSRLGIAQANRQLGQQQDASQLAWAGLGLSAQEMGLKVAQTRAQINATNQAARNRPIDLAGAQVATYKQYGINPTTRMIPKGTKWTEVISTLGAHIIAQGVVKGSARYWQLLKQGIAGLRGQNGMTYHGKLGPYTL